MCRLFREIRWGSIMVVYDERADVCVSDKWRAVATALVEDEDVSRMIGFHQSALGRAVDCVAFA